MANNPAAFTRRGFLGLTGGAAIAAVLAACSTGGAGGGSGGSLKFWNQPWGGPAFNPLDKKITLAYKPANGLPSATYQTVQWANFLQTYSSAIASNTGPAVSSGGGTQAFMFEAQGKIAYADHLVSSWASNGLKDDFLPGLLDTMKTKNGYAAIPYNLDMRPLFYNEALLQQAGASVPTDWQGWLDTSAALKKIGVFGFGTGTGAGTYVGGHTLVSLMINNGGGLFDEKQQPNCVTPANIEAIEFVLENVSKGYVDPQSVSYTDANIQEQWKAKKFGMGVYSLALASSVGAEVGPSIKLTSPLASPSGKKGALFFPNNIMMYKHTPSQKGSEAFLTYYYKNMAPLWTKGTGIGLPPLKSITETPEFRKDANSVKAIEEWQPISKTWAAPGGDALFSNVTTVDGTPAMDTFTQSVLSGSASAKDALTTLQNAIKAKMK
jgi:multiple sugar transport system substrate-binding protein